MGEILGDIADAIGSWFGSKAQQEEAQKAMDLQKQMYDQSRSDRLPFMQAGQGTLSDLLQQFQSGGFNTSVDPSMIANDPGYQFRMQQAQQALERSAAARGGLNSGAFMKGLDRYSQGLASDEFGQAFQRQQSENQLRFGRMFGVAGMGENAAAGLGQLGQGYANSMGSLYGAMGNARAAGIKGVTNGISSGFNDLQNNAMQAIGMMGGGGGMGAMGGGGGMGGFGGGGYGGGYGGGGYGAPNAYSSGNYSLGSYNLVPPQGGGY